MGGSEGVGGSEGDSHDEGGLTCLVRKVMLVRFTQA